MMKSSSDNYKMWSFSIFITLILIIYMFVHNYFNEKEIKPEPTIEFTSDKFEKLKSDFEKIKIVQFIFESDVYVTIDLNENKITANTTNGLIFRTPVKATKDLKTNIVQFDGEGNQRVYDLLSQMKGDNMYEILDSYFKINYLNNATGKKYRNEIQYDKNDYTYFFEDDKLTEIRGINNGGFYIRNISYN